MPSPIPLFFADSRPFKPEPTISCVSFHAYPLFAAGPPPSSSTSNLCRCRTDCPQSLPAAQTPYVSHFPATSPSLLPFGVLIGWARRIRSPVLDRPFGPLPSEARPHPNCCLSCKRRTPQHQLRKLLWSKCPGASSSKAWQTAATQAATWKSRERSGCPNEVEWGRSFVPVCLAPGRRIAARCLIGRMHAGVPCADPRWPPFPAQRTPEIEATQSPKPRTPRQALRPQRWRLSDASADADLFQPVFGHRRGLTTCPASQLLGCCSGQRCTSWKTS